MNVIIDSLFPSLMIQPKTHRGGNVSINEEIVGKAEN